MKPEVSIPAGFAAPARQRGVALIFGMVILLILTIIGITAVRSTTQQERMASANQQQAQTFEAAESTIQFVMSQLVGDKGTPTPTYALLLAQAVSNGMNPQPTPEPVIPVVALSGSSSTSPPNAVLTITPTASAGDSKITTSARFLWVSTNTPGCTGSSLAKFAPYGFVIDATATDQTGVTVRNIQNICFLAPKLTS